MLYQQDLLGVGVEAALGRFREASMDQYASSIVRGVASYGAAIDVLLSEHLSGWTLQRLGFLERAILRVAAYELLKETDTPVAVVVDEAVNLAKRFCSGEAGGLVNGILGNAALAARPTGPPGADEAEEAGEAK